MCRMLLPSVWETKGKNVWIYLGMHRTKAVTSWRRNAWLWTGFKESFSLSTLILVKLGLFYLFKK